MKILVTGATGFIGSHTCIELMNAGYDIIGIDNFVNSKLSVLDRIEKISGKNIEFYEGDVTEEKFLDGIFKNNSISAVIHFAALKAVGESVTRPLDYYYNNVLSTLMLCKIMKKYNCKKIIFSSSATVYGTPKVVPITELFPVGETTNPYGTTKLMCERILKDLYSSDSDWSICILRYFNPIGGHESGLLGEDPNDIPNNLMPYIVKVAAKQLPFLNIFGNDYDTKDGTGVRDFIHVVDLAKGHVKALNKITKNMGLDIYNIGTGKGYSVLDLVNIFSEINNVEIPYVIVSRRIGDVAECYSDPSKANKELKWKATKDINDMCKDSWNFFMKNSIEEK